MPLARILGGSAPAQRSALRASQLADRAEPALTARRRDDERRRIRCRLVWRAPDSGVFHSTEPAWNDQNLHELADHISSSNFFAHIRAAIGSSVQQTNCHPFRHDRWLFMHNCYINEFAALKRDLVFAVDPVLYSEIAGQTDSEILFFLALTFGLEDDPPAAIERAVGLVEQVAGRHGVANPFQGTIATTSGGAIWASRYSSEGKSRSLFYTTDVPTLRKLYPERELYEQVSEDAHMVVSEPLGEVREYGMKCPRRPVASSVKATTRRARSGRRHRSRPSACPPRARWDRSLRGFADAAEASRAPSLSRREAARS